MDSLRMAALALVLSAAQTQRAFAEAPTAAPAGADPAAGAPGEERLPFAIADEKRLSDEDLADKKEGAFVTGIPDLSFDPLNGFGLGAEGYLTFNGKRDDPFFAYTPYRRRIEVAAFVTTKLTREFRVALDEPYLLDTKWRLRAEAAYEVNPNQLYFGTTERTLQNLGSLLPASSPYADRSVGSYDAYTRRLATIRPGGPGEAALVADNLYDYYTKDEKILNVSLEHAYFDGRVRAVGGFEVAFLNIGHDDGKRAEATDAATGASMKVANGRTRLTEDQQAGRIHGASGGLVTILQSGLVYDTRDLEPDPSRGIFAEATNELSTSWLGSAFTFDKLFLHAKFYYSLFPKTFSKLVLAGRIGAGNTFGAAPFFEFADQWSTEGSIEGLGGFHSLRGYKQSRFMGRTMAFANIELRYRFAQAKVLGHTFGFMLLPFFDVGGVWDKPSRVNVANLRYSEGAGLRLAWNQSTIVAFDYAFSEEDHQFFLELNHAF
jgi:outer membrane protein assembly factor BamA